MTCPTCSIVLLSNMATNASKRKPYKELTLAEKVELIKASSGTSQRKLAEQFGCGKTQVSNILKRKAEYMTAYTDNQRTDSKRPCLRGHYDELDNHWFVKIRGANMPVSGPLLQEKATHFAREMNITDFKASNGWLHRFKTRHNITCLKVCGEAGSVDKDVEEDWLSRVPDIIKDYDLKNIYNMDETGVFYRALPDKSLSVRGQACSGGKKSKDRLTVFLYVNALEQFEKPIVIGHCKKPR